ncbi:amino acid ABC transporter permease [Saccharospirillum salsuginis]|uniref:Amino acid ABC transporter n=1 Tax=Saccharospirillum salsuginis TaxID=418750 RepID=A0A918KML5_9GAMM|nr:amino acid ABC transporter permease [Saccharospirillum salsuginis]GGX68729.1 amino acid ABC transporter [Saccharospirillum salsuginis]
MDYFSGLQLKDLGFLAEAAGRTLLISGVSIGIGSLVGLIFGWLLTVLGRTGRFLLNAVLDVFRSIPLLIQLVLFYNLFPIIGFSLGPFAAGTLVLTVYTVALVSNVTRSGLESVSPDLRRAARSLGLSYWQDMRHIVWPVGLRAVFPAWVGVALSVVKDSALVSVLGYVELLRASQTLITRTQEPLIILAIAGAFYFALSFPMARAASLYEKRWAQ